LYNHCHHFTIRLYSVFYVLHCKHFFDVFKVYFTNFASLAILATINLTVTGDGDTVARL